MTPKTVKEWFESELNPKMRKLLLERMEYPDDKANSIIDAVVEGFDWSGTTEGRRVWRHYWKTGIFVAKPWLIASPTTTYTRILASIKGKLHYFPLECDGKDIDMYMPLNDALDWMREDQGINVFAVALNTKERELYKYYPQVQVLPLDESVLQEPWGYDDYRTAIAAGLNKACDIVNDKNEQPNV